MPLPYMSDQVPLQEKIYEKEGTEIREDKDMRHRISDSAVKKKKKN